MQCPVAQWIERGLLCDTWPRSGVRISSGPPSICHQSSTSAWISVKRLFLIENYIFIKSSLTALGDAILSLIEVPPDAVQIGEEQ